MAEAQKWLQMINSRGADSNEKKWIARGKKIIKRYRDERDNMLEEVSRFNILWSNVETILPALYSRPPKAEVSRRNKDSNPVARTATRILERALQYEIDQYPDFDLSVKAAILDRLLPGRGVVWVRFEQYETARPDVEPEPLVSEPVTEVPDILQSLMGGDPAAVPPHGEMIPPPSEESGVDPEMDTPTIKERACVDYVFWEDFRHGEARQWSDVPWVARREYLTREQGIERFGDVFKSVPLHKQPVGTDETNNLNADKLKKACVWEIWDKESRKAIWIAEAFDQILDERDDPYGLEGFFPCPRPLYATQTNDQLTPVPDFSLYQDQADEIDLLTTRIKGLTRALKLNGAYDQSSPQLANILDAPDNTLIPIQDWATLSEKGGLANTLQWVPLTEVVGALQAAWAAREQAKQVVYEITGISDIIRGATRASETATAQSIKRQFGSLRLQTRQMDIAKFCTEVLRIKAQLMCDIYSPETLIAISGIEGTEDAEFVPQAIELLQSEPLREYQISVASDSLVAINEEQEKEDRMEFLAAVGGYLQQAIGAVQAVPELAPLAMSMLMFSVRAFPAAKPLEGDFERFQEAINNRPPVDPNASANAEAEAAQAKMQAEMQIEQARLQVQLQGEQMKYQMQAQAKQAEVQADVQAANMKAQADMQVQQSRMQMQAELEQNRANMQADVDRYRAEVDAQSKATVAQMQMEFERWKAELENATKIQIAQMQSASKGVIQIDPATQAATDEISREIKP